MFVQRLGVFQLSIRPFLSIMRTSGYVCTAFMAKVLITDFFKFCLNELYLTIFSLFCQILCLY